MTFLFSKLKYFINLFFKNNFCEGRPRQERSEVNEKKKEERQMKRKIVIWGAVFLIVIFLAGIFGGCGKKEAAKEEQPQEEEIIQEETPEVPEEVSETPQEPENLQVTQQETAVQPTPSSVPAVPKRRQATTPPQVQPPTTQPQPQWTYETLVEEKREFTIFFTQWDQTGVEGIDLPNDVIKPQEIDITAVFSLYTPTYYDSPLKNQKDGAIIPMPIEGTFEAPDKINFKERPGYYAGEDCLEVRIKESSVIVETASGPKTIDTTKAVGWDTAAVARESWPTTVSLPAPIKDARNIEAVAVIPPAETKIEVPAKLFIPEPVPGTVGGHEVYITYPASPEKKISGELVVTGEVQK